MRFRTLNLNSGLTKCRYQVGGDKAFLIYKLIPFSCIFNNQP